MSVFEEACYLSNQRWIASLPTEFEAFEFSKNHQKRMNILFDKMRKDKYHRLTRKATVALIAAILVLSMTVTAFAIPATRDFIIHRFFDYSQYSVVNGEQTVVEDLEIGYIPEGFVKTDENLFTYYIECVYKSNNDEYFDISKAPLNTKTVFNTEQYYKEEIVHNGITYIYYQNEDTIGCVWNNGEYIYTITGDVPKEQLLNIAYSVKR